MRNWLGQDIVPGSTVYRGARAGNTSSFAVGTVVSVNEDTRKVRVDWKFGPGAWYYRRDAQGNTERLTGAVGTESGSGSPGIDTVVLVDVDLGVLEQKVELAKEWRETGMPTSVYEQRLEEIEGR